VTLFLCGDVMLGRGVDQILPHPGDPTLRESSVRDARRYVELAERVNGPIHGPVDIAWVWGDALPALDAAAPDIRVVNLETSVTTSDEFAVDKAVLYRMSPANIPALTAVRPDVCVLANNHVLDFGRTGLAETLSSLAAAGVQTAGAGRDLADARRPAAVPIRDERRILVFALGMATSGVPPDWAATADRSGVDFVREPSAAAADEVVERVRTSRRPGDVVVVSVHWGSNWGYGVSSEEITFAHRLVDGGVDVVHGHSSHHPRPIEVYHGKLILYGCGDLVDDYEGIGGHVQFRNDLRLLYLATVDGATGRLAGLRMLPLQARRMRLTRPAGHDAMWLQSTLDRISRRFGVRVDLTSDGTLRLRWAGGRATGGHGCAIEWPSP
jgi:poly-gamma-glutamate capsule biosynthesis protein CapA/YwtB (metallophosphatase superfamily)